MILDKPYSFGAMTVEFDKTHREVTVKLPDSSITLDFNQVDDLYWFVGEVRKWVIKDIRDNP